MIKVVVICKVVCDRRISGAMRPAQQHGIAYACMMCALISSHLVSHPRHPRLRRQQLSGHLVSSHLHLLSGSQPAGPPWDCQVKS